MSTERPQCWDIMKCNVFSQCPAYPDQGRICFTVRGTLCRGEQQGGFLEKFEACKSVCRFYPMLES